jgi:2'-5' RNA ligase
MNPILLVTLKLDDASFQHLDALRRQYFPPERNHIPAHVTLFHALPGGEAETISADLDQVAGATARFSFVLPRLWMLGRGVAATVEAPALHQLRQQLASWWAQWLKPQDQQNYRPHITIQNKVSPDQARALYEQLSLQWEPLTGQGIGLILWHYLGGPWQEVQTFPFTTA